MKSVTPGEAGISLLSGPVSSARGNWCLSIGLAVVVWGGPGLPWSSQGGERRLTDLVELSQQSRRPLSDFMGGADLINLEGSSSRLEIDIPLNRRIDLLGGEIEIHYAHSLGLDPERSRLRVSWDDEELGVRSLGGAFREGRLLGRLPASMPSIDRFLLGISVEQRQGDRARDTPTPADTDPWTQVDPSRSWVSLNYRKKTLQPLLSEVRGLIDNTLWDDYSLGVITAPVYATGESHLKWGERVVQRAALWLGDRPLRIRHDDEISDRGDEVVIGCRDELIDILPQGICDQISHSFIGVYAHPENQGHFLLVISGLDEVSVDRAVRSFVFFPDRLPELPRIDVTRWELPASDPRPGDAETERTVRMPDLDSWARLGYPGAAGFDLWVAHRDSQTIASAWMVAGKLAQEAGEVVTSLAVVGQKPNPKRHWIAFGALDQIPSELVEASPLSILFREGDLMGRKGVLTQFESPFQRGRAGGLVTAGDRVLLEDRVAELIQEDLWSQLHGDAVVWQGGAESARFRRVSETFEIGEVGALVRWVRWCGGLPWLSIILGLMGAGTIAWLLMYPVHDVDPEMVGVTRRNGNRRMSRGRRLRQAARRAARLDRPPQSAG